MTQEENTVLVNLQEKMAHIANDVTEAKMFLVRKKDPHNLSDAERETVCGMIAMIALALCEVQKTILFKEYDLDLEI